MSARQTQDPRDVCHRTAQAEPSRPASSIWPQRSVLVDDVALGYEKGINELPPATPFELKVEVLSVSAKA